MNTTYRPSGGGYALTPVVKNLLIINVLAFIVPNFVLPGLNLEYLLGLNYGFQYLKPWQFITYMFLHANFSHLLFNMLALWMFGTVIEQTLGSRRFLYFYLVCGIGAALIQLIVLYMMVPVNAGPITTIGASGSVFGLLFAFGYLYPNMNIYFYFLIPLKAKYFVVFYAVLELYLGIKANEGDNVAHFAHLGGMLFAFILLKVWKTPRRLH